MRLRGSGVGAPDADRAAIPLDPHVAADVGTRSFTIEWWLWTRSRKGANGASRVECGWGNVAWIHGNIVLDRDRYCGDPRPAGPASAVPEGLG